MVDRYTHGHHESVLRSHRWRTAENSAPHLLEHLRPGQRLLDVGCGPGTVTTDLASLVAPGQVVGLDPVESVLLAAEADRATAGVTNVTYVVGSVYDLSTAQGLQSDGSDPGRQPAAQSDLGTFDLGTFDIVHAHQVLQHLTDPVAAISEMGRVLAPGGLLALRESDYGAFTWAPADPRLDRWMELYHQVTAANGADADAGRHLLGWARAAGCTDIVCTSSNWTYATPAEREWWGGLWADRIVGSSFAEQAIELGSTDRAELPELAEGFRQWAIHDDAVFVVPSVEIVASAPPG